MLAAILKNYRKKKGLVIFFVLTYLDKGISFALPLAILFILKDKSLYAFVEVAFSYATIVMVLVELGLSNYLFWGYKETSNKDVFIEKAQVFFRASIFLYCLLSICVLVWLYTISHPFFILYTVIAARTLYIFYLNFYSNIFRLKDTPSKIYWISVAINLSSVVMVLIAYHFKLPNTILFFILPSAAFVISVSFKFILEINLFFVREFLAFLKDALRFSWPIILNVLAMSFINNYAKIYAYGHLSESEMVQISYIMRIGLLIQLSHAAYASYFSKTLFMDKSKKFNTVIFKQYSFVIFFSILLVLALIQATNLLFSEYVWIPFSLSTMLFLFHIVLWCFIGYLELYFGIMNANRLILYYSVISSVVYILLLKFYGEVNLLQLSIFMVTAGLINIILVLIGLRKFQIFRKNPELLK